MTTIEALPEEILSMIFDKLVDPEAFDLVYCQYVCKAWYLPAHLTLLKEISLSNENRIKQFIRSIDYNPDPIYLKAVKSVSIDNLDDPDRHCPVDKVAIRKTLHRFPNLESASFLDSLMFFHEFDDDLCNELIQCCPNIEDFHVDRCSFMLYPHFTPEEYYAVLKKVRPFVTKITLDSIPNPPKGVVQFLTTFPRLRETHGYSDAFVTLEDWLPVFEKLDNFEGFLIRQERDDVENFAERLLDQKTEHEKRVMIKKLANVYSLTIRNSTGFLLNSYKFVAKYFTGLQIFDIFSELDKDWTDTKQRMFCDIVIDFARNVDVCNVHLSMTTDVISKYLPLVVYKLFNLPPTDTTPRVFIVRMFDDRNVNQVMLNTRTKKREVRSLETCGIGARVRQIEVVFRNVHSPHKVAEYIHKASVFDNVDEFRYVIPKRDTTTYEVDIASYETIMGKMPSLKKVILDVPASFKETKETWNSTFPKVEQVTFQASWDGKIQSLLDKSYTVFPNLKHLKLYYFCGIWHPFNGEYRIDLGQYKLDRLTVDVTPVHRKMQIKKNETDPRTSSFLIVVEFLASGKRQLYQVNFMFKSVNRLYDEDLERLVRKEDYLQVHITVSSLESLELCKVPWYPQVARGNYLEDIYEDAPIYTLIDLEEPPYEDEPME